MVAPDSAERRPRDDIRPYPWRQLAERQSGGWRSCRANVQWQAKLTASSLARLGTSPTLRNKPTLRNTPGSRAGRVWMARSHGIGARSHARVSGSADSNIHRVPAAVADAQLQLRRPVERSDTVRGCLTSKGVLRSAPRPRLPPLTCPPKMGVIDFHDAEQRLGVVPLAHRLHELVLQHPSHVVAHLQLALEIHRRDAVLGLAEQVNGQEPSRQGQLGVVGQRAGGEPGLMLAADALEDTGRPCADAPGSSCGGRNWGSGSPWASAPQTRLARIWGRCRRVLGTPAGSGPSGTGSCSFT